MIMMIVYMEEINRSEINEVEILNLAYPYKERVSAYLAKRESNTMCKWGGTNRLENL